MTEPTKPTRSVAVDLLLALSLVAVVLVIGVSACPPSAWVPETATSATGRASTPFEPEPGEPCKWTRTDVVRLPMVGGWYLSRPGGGMVALTPESWPEADRPMMRQMQQAAEQYRTAKGETRFTVTELLSWLGEC